MLYSNDFEKPHYLVISSVPESNKDFDRGDFDFTDPHGFKLNSVEKEFYKANDIRVDNAFGSACDPHLAMDLEHENEPANNDLNSEAVSGFEARTGINPRSDKSGLGIRKCCTCW